MPACRTIASCTCPASPAACLTRTFPASLQVVVAKYAKGMVTPDVLQLASAPVPSELQEGDVLVKVGGRRIVCVCVRTCC
jgi:hypothetical protein